VVVEGAVSELIGLRDRLRLATTDDVAARRVLSGLDFVESVIEADGALLVELPPERAADVSEALARAAIYPTELRTISTSLEEYFLDVTAEETE
jgi:hypothetical protein